MTKAPQGHVYLHVEHERKHRNQGYDKLPLMLNYLLYNGIAEDYPHFEAIYGYCDRPDLAKLVMGMSFLLANLNKQSEEALLTHGAVSMMEVLLKRASRPKFSRWAKEHQLLMQKLPAEAYLNAGLDYALDVGKDKAEEIIDAFVFYLPRIKRNNYDSSTTTTKPRFKRRYAKRENGDSSEYAYRATFIYTYCGQSCRPYKRGIRKDPSIFKISKIVDTLEKMPVFKMMLSRLLKYPFRS